ncbi:MAG: DeoR family transcriptional regulator, partial [Candidatus Sulfotelmatobacter sp.]
MSKLQAPSPPGMASSGQPQAEGTVPQDKQQVRFTAILTDLQQTGRVSVETLSEQLDVSVVTIRRDLDALEQKGLLRRT